MLAARSLATTSTETRTAKPNPAIFTPWKAALSRGEFVLGPDISSWTLKPKHAAAEKLEQAWDISGQPSEPLETAEQNKETANRNNPPVRKWVPDDRYSTVLV